MNSSDLFKPRSFALLAVLGLVACVSRQPAPLVAEVRPGPTPTARPERVLALSATCGSAEFACPQTYVSTVNEIVRSSMDFAGYAVVQPSQLRLETRQRHETHEHEVETSSSTTNTKVVRTLDFDDQVQSEHASRSERTASTVVLDGPGFEDLTITERRTALEQAGADAVLVVRVLVGAEVGLWSPDQSVEVMVKLNVDDGSTMAWASRCSASSNDFSTVTAALENATRCAIYGGTGN